MKRNVIAVNIAQDEKEEMKNQQILNYPPIQLHAHTRAYKDELAMKKTRDEIKQSSPNVD